MMQKKDSRDSTNTSNETTSPTTDAITIRSNGAYIYSVGTLAVLVIGICVFFAYKTSQAANQKQVMKNKINHQNDVYALDMVMRKALYNK